MKKIIVGISFLISAILVSISSCNSGPQAIALNVAAKPFELLSQYHFFAGVLNELKPNGTILPYDLISPLFSDYSHKARFVYVPEGKQVSYDDKEVLNLPVGGCYIKSFYYPKDFRDVAKGRRLIETRLLVHRESGWEALDYIWNDEQTDAKLDVAGDIKKVNWTHYDGTARTLDYVIPNKNQCKGCHWVNNIGILPIGPKARNLNKEIVYADGSKNQLTKWTEAGILKGAPASADCPKMADYNNTEESLDRRARAYLDVNCAHCHRAEGPAYTSGLYVNYDQENMEHVGLCKSPVAAGKGTGGRLVDIAPGKPDESIIVYRMEAEDPGVKMPEVGRVLVHKEGVALIRAWIAEMKGGCKN